MRTSVFLSYLKRHSVCENQCVSELSEKAFRVWEPVCFWAIWKGIPCVRTSVCLSYLKRHSVCENQCVSELSEKSFRVWEPVCFRAIWKGIPCVHSYTMYILTRLIYIRAGKILFYYKNYLSRWISIRENRRAIKNGKSRDPGNTGNTRHNTKTYKTQTYITTQTTNCMLFICCKIHL
jgi:hypothetical protein